MVSISEVVREVKSAILEVQDVFKNADLKITKFDVIVRTIFNEKQGIDGGFELGPLSLNLKRTSGELSTNTITVSFIPEELDVELQGDLGGQLIECISLMVKEIELSRANYPDFKYSSSSIEVSFDINEDGKIQVLFGHEHSNSIFHSVIIYFE